MYKGQLVDVLDGEIMHTTRNYATWEQAHRAAEKLAKRHDVYDYEWVAVEVITCI